MLTTLLDDRETLLRLLRFLLVGGGTALLQVGVLKILRMKSGETFAFTGSWVISTLAHYTANRFWALPSDRHDSLTQFWEYLFVVTLSYGINLGLFKVFRSRLGLSPTWATLSSIPPSTVVVFLVLNYRVFG